MAKQNLEQFKNILKKYGLDYPPPDVLVEICENIQQLATIISSFEARKKPEGPSPPKNLK